MVSSTLEAPEKVFPWHARQPALLVLADGTAFPGWSFGAPGTAVGEVVFNTGMTGYQEVITDPSYRGQMVTFTCPELGNTGVNELDEESARPQVAGIIARNVSRLASSWRATSTLPEYLQRYGIPAIAGVDTRALARRLRSQGVMNGAISTEILDPQALLERVRQAPSMQGLSLVAEVTTPQPYEWLEPTPADWDYGRSQGIPIPDPPLRVVALDFGIKRNILRRLARYGCRVMVLPAHASPEEILSYNPDGILLSNGPGDPAAETTAIRTTQALLQSGKPMFGICLGHQILSLALGGSTYKLKFGHRGLNHPCGLEKEVEITSQNHGFAVEAASLPGDGVAISYLNLNDRTVAGIRHRQLPLFSVQYHPEASPGPHDADHLFREFVELMLQNRSR
ncbi:carbamoyl phosphate synthase small subunit [Synechococcus sp. 60AY4M2]|uniref:glutamine-hydrolyzing carbamoyl-phosphate synthase small subunit n=1 Tax=unclassified Synechococcus TaxID=2626047 RepID=UPI000C182124|nr:MULTISPECIES: glutamine-hydrolyzing carbamoyl-phosphate synthase small subunit [unclassified Synechococcus]PIK95150.1 carbamoyl phosphate synthase small subunit [Synechococcus sp. 60AY4M2]PIK97393.1 carbamoyl phosphate synthase small subunit [Synechococcus sp. 63AY4M1]PIL01886.1 carbamoyl phosphate synthase small subunit [Synechococcus sp. 65AY640]